MRVVMVPLFCLSLVSLAFAGTDNEAKPTKKPMELIESGFGGLKSKSKDEPRKLKDERVVYYYSFFLPYDEYSFVGVDAIAQDKKHQPTEFGLNFHNDSTPGRTSMDETVSDVIKQLVDSACGKASSETMVWLQERSEKKLSSIREAETRTADGCKCAITRVGSDLVFSLTVDSGRNAKN